MSAQLIQGEDRTVLVSITEKTCDGECGQPPVGIDTATDFMMSFPGNVTPIVLRSVKLAFLPAALVAASSLIKLPAHGLAPGEVLRLTTSGTLPAPLALATDYYVGVVDADTITLALTSGGNPVVLTDVGVGTTTLEFTTIAFAGNAVLGVLRLTFTKAMLLAMRPFEKLTRDMSYLISGKTRKARFLNGFTLLASDDTSQCGC